MKSKAPFSATIFYTSNMPPHPDHWKSVEEAGFTIVKQENPDPSMNWKYTVNYPKLGTGSIFHLKENPAFPTELIEYAGELTSREREEFQRFKFPVIYISDDRESSLPHKRKDQFRIVRELMGIQSDFMRDNISHRFWSREGLDDELGHGAPLGADALMTFHNVQLENGGIWMHSHGLAELCLFDFDFVDLKDDSHVLIWNEPRRAISNLIMEGLISQNGNKVPIADPKASVGLVEAQKFNSAVGRKTAEKLRPGHSNGHDEDRAVVCEPLSGFFTRNKIKPSRWVRKNNPGRVRFAFSAAASEAMGQRAKATVPTLREYFPFAKEQELAVLVKLKYKADDDNDWEHLWFEVHDLADDHIDATLLNQPFNISDMNEGDRGKHDYERLTEWQILAHMVMADPQSTLYLRELMDVIDEHG